MIFALISAKIAVVSEIMCNFVSQNHCNGSAGN